MGVLNYVPTPHRFVGHAATNPGAREPEPVDYLFGPWDVSRRTTPVIGPPLRGDGWFVVNGCCSGAGAHRGSVQTDRGHLASGALAGRSTTCVASRATQVVNVSERDPAPADQDMNERGDPVID